MKKLLIASLLCLSLFGCNTHRVNTRVKCIKIHKKNSQDTSPNTFGYMYFYIVSGANNNYYYYAYSATPVKGIGSLTFKESLNPVDKELLNEEVELFEELPDFEEDISLDVGEEGQVGEASESNGSESGSDGSSSSSGSDGGSDGGSSDGGGGDGGGDGGGGGD